MLACLHYSNPAQPATQSSTSPPCCSYKQTIGVDFFLKLVQLPGDKSVALQAGQSAFSFSPAAPSVLQWLHPDVTLFCSQMCLQCTLQWHPTFSQDTCFGCIAWPAAVRSSKIPLPCGSPCHAPNACRVAMGHRGADHRQQDAGQLHLWRPSCHSCVRHHKSPGRWSWLSCLTWDNKLTPLQAFAGLITLCSA